MTTTDDRNLAATITELKRILAEQLNGRIPVEQIHESSSLEEDLGLDSVAIVELIGAIEGGFSIVFQDSDLRTSVFQNVGTLAEAVARRASATT